MFRKNSASNCGFGGSSVEYIYGEMAVDHISAFEDHLEGCESCISEIASVSEARFEVFEWRKLSFDPLPTPVIRIPYGEPASTGVLASFATLFSRYRLWTGGALAAASLALLAWLSFSAVLYSPEVPALADVSQLASSASSTEPARPEQPDYVSGSRTVAAVKDSQEKPGVHGPTAIQAKTKTPSQRSVKVQLASDRRPGQRNTGRRSVPTLTGYSAEEDSSLRLAQVFDEIGSLD